MILISLLFIPFLYALSMGMLGCMIGQASALKLVFAMVFVIVVFGMAI